MNEGIRRSSKNEFICSFIVLGKFEDTKSPFKIIWPSSSSLLQSQVILPSYSIDNHFCLCVHFFLNMFLYQKALGYILPRWIIWMTLALINPFCAAPVLNYRISFSSSKLNYPMESPKRSHHLSILSCSLGHKIIVLWIKFEYSWGIWQI